LRHLCVLLNTCCCDGDGGGEASCCHECSRRSRAWR
jgi:hypothetical protein